MKVFLGGTCNGSKWREELIPLLQVGYFNPVVDEWTAFTRMRAQDSSFYSDESEENGSNAVIFDAILNSIID